MLALQLTATLTGVTDLRPSDAEGDPFYYMFKVSCTSCREVHDNWIGVSRYETRDISGSRGEANFVWRCKNCKRESSAMIKNAPQPYEFLEVPKPKKILEIECRGCEFVEFKPEGNWEADGVESNTPFKEIDLSEGEWYEYDEKASSEVSIKDLRWEVVRA